MSASQPTSLVPVFTATGSLTGIPGAVAMRDAQAASHAADGAARVTGRPAIVVAEGLADTLKVASGLVTATGDRQLVVALVSVAPIDRAIVEPALVTASRSWVDAIGMTAAEVVERVADHTPLRLPVAVLLDGPEQTAAVAALLAESIPPEPVSHALAPVGEVEGLSEALADLREARRPLVLVGHGAAATADPEAIAALARAWEAPVCLTFAATGMAPHALEAFIAACADDVPVMAAGTVPWTEALARADRILALGSGLSEADWFGLTDARVVRTPVIRVALDPHPDGVAEMTVIAEAGAFAVSLREELERGGVLTVSGWREKFTEARQRWTEAVDDEAEKDAQRDRLTAALAMREIVAAASAQTVFVGEGGASGMWLASYGWRRPVMIPAQHASIGASIGMSVGIREAAPDLPVWAVVGDGAFFYCSRELAGLAERKVPMVAFVFADRSWNAIRLVQTLFFRRRTVGTDLPPVDYVGLAKLHGCEGIEVRTPGGLAHALAMAQEAREKPLVVQVTIDKGSIPFVGANLILAELDGVLGKLVGAIGTSGLVAAARDFPALRSNVRVILGALKK
jgi:acetolactate synthase-1/2/3 large subunit